MAASGDSRVPVSPSSGMARSPTDSWLVAAVLFLILVPVGSSVFVLGFVHGDSPCILCWQQRVGMAVIALLGLFVLRYGPRPRYLGLSVVVGAYGLFMGIRHAGLHLSRDIGQGFSLEILGAHTYTWSFFIFWSAVVVMGVLMLRLRNEDLASGPVRPWRFVDRLAVVAFLVVMAGNLVQAIATSGPPPFLGQSDPIRFSFNPAHWTWSLDQYRAAPVSVRGRWAVDRPDARRVDRDPATGPFTGLARLPRIEHRLLTLPIQGVPTGLDYDARADHFVITTEHGVYVTDATFERVVRSAVVDPLFAVDLGRFADVGWLGEGRLVAVTENKSFVVLGEPKGAVDVRRNFRFFLEGRDAFEEVMRSRFATVRARLQFVMAAATDPEAGMVWTVTVPNARHQRLVVSRFDANDMTLSEEFVPTLSPALAGRLADPELGARALDRLYVTGAAMVGGRLVVLSAAHGLLVDIDLSSREAVDARTIDLGSVPAGLAIRHGRFYAIGEDRNLWVFGQANDGPS